MPWTQLGDIKPRYSHVTLVAGDWNVVRAWPGAEAAGFPDDEYALEHGVVTVFDLELLRPIVFAGQDAARLLASPDGRGSLDKDATTLAAAVEQPASDVVQGTFEVTSGAMAVLCADWAGSDVGLAQCGEPTLTTGVAIIPCANGRYVVTERTRVKAAMGDFDYLLQVTIHRA